VKYFFESKEKQKELGEVLESWENTPFRHWAGVKGLGCDCIHFVTRVMEEVGASPVQGETYKILRYPKDWHLHNGEELLLKGILGQMKVEPVGTLHPINGDILLFKFGEVCSHSSIYYDGRLYHSLTNIGVRKTPYADNKWIKRLKYNFRVLS